MNAAELVHARTRLGLTPEAMAAELGIPPHAYAACEDGRATLPRREARQVTYHLALHERDEALAASGLPPCAWADAWAERMPEKLDEIEAYMKRHERHLAGCATCQARERFVLERFPDPPKPPMPLWMEAAGAAYGWVQARPAWMRPAILGAALLAAMTSLRVLFVLPAAIRRPRELAMALGVVALAAAAGAFGGLVYSFVGKPLRRVPVAGPYLAGTVSVAGYLLAAGAMISLADPDERFWDGSVGSAIFFVVLCVLLGSIVGHQALREKGSPTG